MTRSLAWSLLTATSVALTCAFSTVPASAAPTTVPGEVIVRYRTTLTAARRARTAALLPGREVVHALGFIDAEHLRVPGWTTEAIVARLQSDPDVRYVEPNHVITVEAIPDDSSFALLWGLRNTGQGGGYAGDDIDATLAWDLTTGDPDLRVGVIDSGVDYTHPDLVGNVWTNPLEIPDNGLDDDANGYPDDVHGYDVLNGDGDPMDDFAHGTHVAGTIAATGNNGLGVTGVAWRCKLVPIKFIDATGIGSEGGAIAAIQYAVTLGLRLTNNSWGNMPGGQALFDAIEAAGAAGQLLVFAAGNNNRDLDLVPYYPAAFHSQHMIKVAATDARDLRASFSSYGPTTVDLGAPGYGIHSCKPGGLYQTLNGTSMAAPHVTGVAALAMSRSPYATAPQIRQLILGAVDPIPAMAGITVTGGRLNAYRALLDGDAVPPGSAGGFACADSTASTLGLRWSAPGDDDTVGTASRYELRMSTSPIDPAGFDAAVALAAPVPGAAGSPESLTVGGLPADVVHHFALRALDDFGNRGPIATLAASTTGAAAVEGSARPDFGLRVASANPGRGGLRFELSVPVAGDLDLSVFDIRGARVRRLLAGPASPGAQPVRWDGRDGRGSVLPPGIYLVRARMTEAEVVRRVALLP